MRRLLPPKCGGSQGFVPEEDASFKKMVAEYEKASGNKIDYSIMPFAPLRQKIISAVTSGVVPDLFTRARPTELIALQPGKTSWST